MVVQKRKKITGKRSQKVGALLLPIVSTIDFVRSETTFSRCSVLTGFKKEGSVSGKRKHGVVFLAMFLVNYSSSDGFGKTITINLILVGGGFIWGGGTENLPGNSKPTPPTNMRYIVPPRELKTFALLLSCVFYLRTALNRIRKRREGKT